MYSPLHLTFAKIINDSYYNNLITNLAKEKYNNPKFGLELKLSDLPTKHIVDIDDKVIDLMYNDLINTKLSLTEENNKSGYSPYLNTKERLEYIYDKSNFKYDIYASSELLKKLINNENYNILYDVLTKTKDNRLKTFLEEKIYPTIEYVKNDMYHDRYDLKICLNEENKELLNILVNNGTDDTIKNQYLIKFMDNLNQHLKDELLKLEDRVPYQEINYKKQEMYNDIIKENIEKINENSIFHFDIKKDLNYIINNIKKDNHNYFYPTFIISLFDYLEIDKYEQYEILKNNFDKTDSIFKSLINNENCYINKVYLTNKNEVVLKLNEVDFKKISELFTTIIQEEDLGTKQIMFNKLIEHFKLDLDFKDLSNLNLTTKEEIKDLSKEEFVELYFKNSNERLNEFENIIKDL